MGNFTSLQQIQTLYLGELFCKWIGVLDKFRVRNEVLVNHLGSMVTATSVLFENTYGSLGPLLLRIQLAHQNSIKNFRPTIENVRLGQNIIILRFFIRKKLPNIIYGY